MKNPPNKAELLHQERHYWDLFYGSQKHTEVLERQIKNDMEGYFRQEFERAERIYKQSFRRQARVLILGSGTGMLAVWCANYFPEWKVVSMDLSSEGLLLHGWVAEQMHQTWNGNCIVADWDNLPFPANTFDFCIADRALHHMLNPTETLTVLARAMKPNAILIGLREPSLAVGYPEMREEFATDAKEGGANDHIWYPHEWEKFFAAANFQPKLRVHLRDCERFFRGWGPNIPGLRRLLRRFPIDLTARVLYPYIWYYGSSKIAKYTIYAQLKS